MKKIVIRITMAVLCLFATNATNIRSIANAAGKPNTQELKAKKNNFSESEQLEIVFVKFVKALQQNNNRMMKLYVTNERTTANLAGIKNNKLFNDLLICNRTVTINGNIKGTITIDLSKTNKMTFHFVKTKGNWYIENISSPK